MMIISWVLSRVVLIISWVLQESCCRAEVERVAVFANSETVQELTGAGLGVGHLCVQAVGQAGGCLRQIIRRKTNFPTLKSFQHLQNNHSWTR